MIFDILTLLPEACEAYLHSSIIGRAREKGLLHINCHNIRDFAHGRHRTVDDTPYGGGPGMVMMASPIVEALESLPPQPAGPAIMLSPRGEVFNHKLAQELAGLPRIIMICGRYEGVDERVRLLKVDREISLGDFVLTGGELAALCLVDAVSRFIPGVLGHEESALEESFAQGLLEYPHYTKPPVYRGLEVPEILKSGHHEQIARFRQAEALRLTQTHRPDLLPKTDKK